MLTLQAHVALKVALRRRLEIGSASLGIRASGGLFAAGTIIDEGGWTLLLLMLL